MAGWGSGPWGNGTWGFGGYEDSVADTAGTADGIAMMMTISGLASDNATSTDAVSATLTAAVQINVADSAIAVDGAIPVGGWSTIRG